SWSRRPKGGNAPARWQPTGARQTPPTLARRSSCVNSLTHNGAAGEQEVLLYGRNSTDDQAEAGTIQNQQNFLRNFAQLYGLQVVGEYWDEGVSGTIPLPDRPDGRRLLEAAEARPGAAVLVYRLDRLGRTLRTLLDAHDTLKDASVTVRSATEPFDTSTPIG